MLQSEVGLASIDHFLENFLADSFHFKGLENDKVPKYQYEIFVCALRLQ